MFAHLFQVLKSISDFWSKSKRRKFFLVFLVGTFALFLIGWRQKRRRIEAPVVRIPPRSSTRNTNSSYLQLTTLSPTNFPFKGLKVSSVMNGVFIEKNPISKLYSWKTENVSALVHLIARNDVYLITQVNSDEEENQIKNLIEKNDFQNSWINISSPDSSISSFGALTRPIAVNPLKILFCSSEEGRVHMVRQLDVHLHIDYDVKVISALKPHIPQLYLVSNSM